MKKKIAIVGGSISGSMLAQLLLHSAKWDIEIFERFKGKFKSGGAGITLPIPLITEINSLITNKPCQFFELTQRYFFTKKISEDKTVSNEIWQQNISAAAVNWKQLHETLLDGLDNVYHAGAEVVDVIYGPNTSPTIVLENGTKRSFDLVVFADGYQSLGRKILYPQITPEYAGYIAWRGTLPVSDISSHAFLGYHCFDNGHFVTVPIPTNDGFLINWLLYTKMDAKELATFMKIQKPSESLTENAIAKLFSLAQKYLPDDISNIITQTTNAFYQVIYDCVTPSVHKDNIILVGDASKILRPHLGSGATEGIRQVFHLVEKIEKNDCFLEAVSAWAEFEDAHSVKMVTLARQLGDALVNNTLNWDEMTPELMDKWWHSLIEGRPWYLVNDAQRSKVINFYTSICR